MIDTNNFEVVDEIEICVPKGGVEFLVLNRPSTECIVTWLDQTEWGYLILDLHSKTELTRTYFRGVTSSSAPQFSPDNSCVVSTHLYRDAWWNDEVDDPWYVPSPGGVRKVGSISVHDRNSGIISLHDILLKLPKGWLPENPEHGEWNMISGPQFISNREFRIWLPDSSPEILTMPLPEVIEITRPISTNRDIKDN